MADEEKNDVLISFHAAQFETCFSWWDDPEEGAATGISSHYAAYHVLAHAAFLLRCGETACLSVIESLPSERVTTLVDAACTYAIGFNLPPEAKSVLQKGSAEPDDIEYIELLLSHRDELDLVIELAKRFARKSQQDRLRRAVASAASVAAEIDDQLLTRADLMSVCSRALAGVRPTDWLCDGSYPDWFSIARSWDKGSGYLAADTSLVSPKSNQSTAAVLLGNRNQEIATLAKTYALAASTGEQPGPAAERLLRTFWSVVGEPAVSVRLELKRAENDERVLTVALIGALSETQKFVSVEIGFASGRKTQSRLECGAADTPLQYAEVGELSALALIDHTGGRRAVELLGVTDDH